MASEERTASAFTFVRRSRSALSVEIGGPIKIRFVWYQSRPRGLCGTVTCSVASRTPLRTRRNTFCCSLTMRKRVWSAPPWAGGGRRKAKSLTALLGAFCAEEFSTTEVGTEGGDGCPSCCSIRFSFSTLFFRLIISLFGCAECFTGARADFRSALAPVKLLCLRAYLFVYV